MPVVQNAAQSVSRCLRQKNVAAQHAQMMDYFGPTCTADVDVESVKSIMGDRWQPVNWSSCMSNAHQLQEQQRLEHLRILAQIPPPPDPRWETMHCDYMCCPSNQRLQICCPLSVHMLPVHVKDTCSALMMSCHHSYEKMPNMGTIDASGTARMFVHFVVSNLPCSGRHCHNQTDCHTQKCALQRQQEAILQAALQSVSCSTAT